MTAIALLAVPEVNIETVSARPVIFVGTPAGRQVISGWDNCLGLANPTAIAIETPHKVAILAKLADPIIYGRLPFLLLPRLLYGRILGVAIAHAMSGPYGAISRQYTQRLSQKLRSIQKVNGSLG